MQGVLQKRAFSSAVKTAVVYFVLSVFWVVATDRLVAMYVKNPQLNLNLQTIKGWLFVVVTTIFLFVILWRERKYYEDSRETEQKFAKVFQSSPYIIIMTRAEDGSIDGNKKWKDHN